MAGYSRLVTPKIKAVLCKSFANLVQVCCKSCGWVSLDWVTPAVYPKAGNIIYNLDSQYINNASILFYFHIIFNIDCHRFISECSMESMDGYQFMFGYLWDGL